MGRNRKDLTRPETHWSKKPLYVIATEGEVTEKVYFNGLFRRKNIRMPILETTKGNSSPEKVLKRLIRYKNEYNASPDELWLVIDRDSWEKKSLETIKRECESKGFNLMISNPCFELWLLLHQKNPKQPLTGKDCEREIKKFIPGFSKSNYNLSDLLENINKAINHAKRLDHKNTINHAPSTKVFELVEKLVSEEDA